ncbi:MAG: DNA/RNA nuclease SfsA [Deltaproteobacteria bacterium]|nr:DNA/RNA nuclease SfsA [Deltaproteobacteria bacterium]
MQLFNNISKAKFISRPNRFIIICDLNGKETKTYLPNPGRLWELLFPGVTLYIERSNNEERKIPWTVVAVESRGRPVMLHTHKTNDAARHLLERGLVPGLEDAEIVRSEVKYGNSRFDFLLKRGDEDIYLEVKSCTLFSERVAMFPDAITERGKRHVEELVHLSSGKTRCVVLFVISSPHVEVFSPEYHTDLNFALTLIKAKDKIDIIPLSIGWRDDLSLHNKVRQVSIPWEKIEREASDRGAYLFMMKLDKDVSIETGSLGHIQYKKGFYIYVGSAMKNLTKRIERHKRLRKNMHWHIDYLRQHAHFHAALPLRTANRIECQLANSLKELVHWQVPSFGSTDCNCGSHLFGMNEDPLRSLVFHDFLQQYRMERLIDLP